METYPIAYLVLLEQLPHDLAHYITKLKDEIIFEEMISVVRRGCNKLCYRPLAHEKNVLTLYEPINDRLAISRLKFDPNQYNIYVMYCGKKLPKWFPTLLNHIKEDWCYGRTILHLKGFHGSRIVLTRPISPDQLKVPIPSYTLYHVLREKWEFYQLCRLSEDGQLYSKWNPTPVNLKKVYDLRGVS
jgi:hypothetical protein